MGRFEDLKIWQLARQICQKIHKITNREPFSKDFSLKNQINASCGSTMDNIAEGHEREGNKEYLQFLYIAKGSCGETRSQIYRAFDRQYISQEEFEDLFKDVVNESTMLQNFIQSIKSSDFKGNKFKPD